MARQLFGVGTTHFDIRYCITLMYPLKKLLQLLIPVTPTTTTVFNYLYVSFTQVWPTSPISLMILKLPLPHKQVKKEARTLPKLKKASQSAKNTKLKSKKLMTFPNLPRSARTPYCHSNEIFIFQDLQRNWKNWRLSYD